MADNTSSSPSRSKDKQSEEPQSAPSAILPPKLEGAVEMEDLTLKPPAQGITSETAVSEPAETLSTSDPTQQQQQQQQTSASGVQEETVLGQNITASSSTTSVAEGEGEITSAVTTESKGKAPATAAEAPLVLGSPQEGSSTASPEPQVEILLISTAASSRHPFRITEKYLTKRNVNVPGVTDNGRMDLLSITIYSLKELILREWRTEWETAPREPASIRLIRLGKMLDDKATLRSYGFSLEAPNVVHMTVKPQETAEEEGGAAKGNKEAGQVTNEGGCGCCIVL